MKEFQLIGISFLLYTIVFTQHLQPFPAAATYIEGEETTVIDRRLYLAAKVHSEYLKEGELQNHNDQFQRIKDNNLTVFLVE